LFASGLEQELGRQQIEQTVGVGFSQLETEVVCSEDDY
jgi:hypothetical protein